MYINGVCCCPTCHKPSPELSGYGNFCNKACYDAWRIEEGKVGRKIVEEDRAAVAAAKLEAIALFDAEHG